MNTKYSLRKMKRAEQIQLELSELGATILMSSPSTMPYSLPINYFSTFNNEISDVININDLKKLEPAWGNKMPFEVPNAVYFEGLSAQILAKVNLEPAWDKTNPFVVPSGYFNSLPAAIVAKVKTEVSKSKKRVPLFRTMQLAASMALFFFAGFALMKMNNTKVKTNTTITSVSKADINDYVVDNLDDFDTDLILNSLAKTDTKLNKIMNVSDDEIKAYLDETGWN